MKDKFYHELLSALDGKVSEESLNIVATELTNILGRYEISVAETSLIKYEGIANLVKVYLVSRKIEGMAVSSLNLYRLRLEMFCKWCVKPIEKIDANDIRLFLHTIKTERNMSDRTLEGVRTILSAFFKWASAEGYIDNDPTATIRTIKFAQTERGHLDEDEMEQLRNVCETPRDRALVEVFYSTGCRVSEVVNMKISDMKNGEVKVLGKGNKERTVYLNARSRRAISEYLMTRGSTNDSLFVSERSGKKLGKDGIESRISYLGDKMGINLYPHLIRHTTATDMVKNGADITEVQKLLGHSNLTTTMIYADIADDSVKKAHERCIV